MIDQTILTLLHTDCRNSRLIPYASKLGMKVNLDPDKHIGIPLSKVFSQIIRFDVGESYAENGAIHTNNKIIELVKEFSPKYVFWPTMTYEVFEETLHEIRESGVYVIGWFFDDECRFENYSRWWIPYMDYIFTSDKAAIDLYHKFAAKAYHLLVSSEAEEIKRINTDLTYDVSFVGSKYVADRELMVNKLDKAGVNISAFGRGWEDGYLSNDEMVSVFCNSKINLCFTKSYSGPSKQMKGKIFDIVLCGGFLLCEYVEGIEDYFEIGKEIDCFNDHEEALEKIDYYLLNHEERKRIALAGKLHAEHDLVQHKLFERAFIEIERDIESNVGRIIKSTSTLQMPGDIRLAHAKYHLRWANVLKSAGFNKKRWQDEYIIARKYVSFCSWMRLRNKNINRLVGLLGRLKRSIL